MDHQGRMGMPHGDGTFLKASVDYSRVVAAQRRNPVGECPIQLAFISTARMVSDMRVPLVTTFFLLFAGCVTVTEKNRSRKETVYRDKGKPCYPRLSRFRDRNISFYEKRRRLGAVLKHPHQGGLPNSPHRTA